MSQTTLVWATPDIDKHLGYIARVSNPSGQANPDVGKLLRYMLREGHVSPFEMCNVCVEINTTRTIGRQFIRHKSIAVQEFSQRYADTGALGGMVEQECRMQDVSNRQSSLPCTDTTLSAGWSDAQRWVWGAALRTYNEALVQGMAKEVARALLPEGLTPSRIYANGSMRSWIFYLHQRLHPSTQAEHRQVAEGIRQVLVNVAPITMAAAGLDTTPE
jgi:thymidylate synthase (FAD)